MPETQKKSVKSYLHVSHALIICSMRTRFGALLWGNSIMLL